MKKEALPENGSNQQRYTLSTDSYGVVLLLICISLVVTALLPQRLWAQVVNVAVLGTTLVSALRISRARLIHILQGVAALVISVLIALSFVLFGREELYWIPAINCAILIAFTPAAIIRRLLSHHLISVETVLGALCIYLLIGLFFTYLYATLGSIFPTAVFAERAQAPLNDCLYFSYVTLTTVGYGDLTPKSGLAKTLAVLEALTGQLYLVTIIALLVGKIGTPLNKRNHEAE